MNCIPGLRLGRDVAMSGVHQFLSTFLILPTLAVLAGCDAPASGQTATQGVRSLEYQVEYVVTPRPALGGVLVELTVRQPRHLLRKLDMRMGDIEIASISADGKVSLNDGRIVWDTPIEGGALRWFAPVAHVRSEDSYDAFINAAWALFRAEDIIPPTRTRTVKGAVSSTQLRFNLSDDWSSTTEYIGHDDVYRIDNPARRFDRPTGWVLLGKIGIRNDNIAGVRVVVAAPLNNDAHRLDILAMLQWTLPELKRIIPDFPARLTIMSAAGPMWRGGLSAPSSLFIHADLPLISENATSTLLHEVLHIGLGLSADDGADWIVEGLAEYYGLELLRRSRSISNTRHKAAIKKLREWGSNVKNLCEEQSTGSITARATVVFHDLDQELRTAKGKNVNYDLDDLIPKLKESGSKVNIAKLQSAAQQIAGFLPKTIESNNLPGCSE